MRQTGKCIKCGSTEIVEGARVIDESRQGFEEDQRLRVDADPHAALFKEACHSTVRAWVCGACGYTEVYADDPGALLQAWRRSQKAGLRITDGE